MERSPFAIVVGDPGKVKCFGPGLESAIVKEPAHFTVDISKAGDGPMDVDINGPQNASCDVNCNESENGVYKVDYTAPRPGIYDDSRPRC